MEFEAKIVSRHNLDISNIERLANDIANRLNVNIRIAESSLSEDGEALKLLGFIRKNDTDFYCTLFQSKKNIDIDDCDYWVEYGEHGILIYKDIIETHLPWFHYFSNMLEEYNRGELNRSRHYSKIFNELKQLGADVVVFVDEKDPSEFKIKINDTWSSYISHVQENAETLTVPL